jgi:hypothetical protein
MLIVDEEKLLIMDKDIGILAILESLSRRLKLPNLIQDILGSESEIQDYMRMTHYRESDIDIVDELPRLLQEVSLPDNTGMLRVTERSIGGHALAIVINIDTPSFLMHELYNRANDFPAVGQLLSETLTLNVTEFTDMLYLKAIKDAQNGDYNAMLLLGSLYSSGVLTREISDPCLTNEEVPLLDMLMVYGYDKSELGGISFTVIPDATCVAHRIELYAKTPQDAARILGTHLDINNDYVVITKPQRSINDAYVYIDKTADAVRPSANVILSGKISDYTGKPNTRHTIKI